MSWQKGDTHKLVRHTELKLEPGNTRWIPAVWAECCSDCGRTEGHVPNCPRADTPESCYDVLVRLGELNPS